MKTEIYADVRACKRMAIGSSGTSYEVVLLACQFVAAMVNPGCGSYRSFSGQCRRVLREVVVFTGNVS